MINWGAWLWDEISFLYSFMWLLLSKKILKREEGGLRGGGVAEGRREINERRKKRPGGESGYWTKVGELFTHRLRCKGARGESSWRVALVSHAPWATVHIFSTCIPFLTSRIWWIIKVTSPSSLQEHVTWPDPGWRRTRSEVAVLSSTSAPPASLFAQLIFASCLLLRPFAPPVCYSLSSTPFPYM